MRIKHVLTHIGILFVNFITHAPSCDKSDYKIKIGDKWYAYNATVSKSELKHKPVALKCAKDSSIIDIRDYEWSTSWSANLSYRGYGFEQFAPAIDKLDPGAILI